MPADEIDRFFQARVVGPDSLALAIHLRDTDRLIGTCAFSQLDGDNGSALFHITIGEKDAWGRGYGTEATELMLEHAFERLGLHRVALSVFAFNERAIRAYRKAGFVVEGRARESIWRDGRYWDELQMSMLDSDWAARRAGRDDRPGCRVVARPTTRRSRSPGSSREPDDGERGAGGGRRPGGGPGDHRGQGPRGRERPAGGRPAGGGVRRRRARPDARRSTRCSAT